MLAKAMVLLVPLTLFAYTIFDRERANLGL